MIKMFHENTEVRTGEEKGLDNEWDQETQERKSRGEGNGNKEGMWEEDASGESEDDSEDDEGPYIEMAFVLLQGV
jgi:hypothetical protein